LAFGLEPIVADDGELLQQNKALGDLIGDAIRLVVLAGLLVLCSLGICSDRCADRCLGFVSKRPLQPTIPVRTAASQLRCIGFAAQVKSRIQATFRLSLFGFHLPLLVSVWSK
jgi:hypothetical protein